jgi:hypothetical protein
LAIISAFRQAWYAPVFSSLLENRREGIVIVGAGVLHLGLSLAGLSVWDCPILAVTGVPCPGCGLTRATMEVLRGEVISSLQTHAFAPVLLLALAVMFFTLILPEKHRQSLLAMVRVLETRNGLTSFLLSMLVLYWCVRLMGILPFPKNF